MCLGVKLVSDQKKLSNAEKGVQAAIEKAQAGELISREGKRINPKSLENLRPKSIGEQPEEKKQEIQSKGGTVTSEKKAKRRTIQEICQAVLAMNLPDTVSLTDDDATRLAEQIQEQTGKRVSVYDAIVCAQTAAAMQGNTKAAEYIRDSAGDKPGENVRLDADIMTEGDRKLLAKLQAAMGIDAE